MRSKIYLMDEADVESRVSKSKKVKQMKINVVEVKWNECLSSKQLQLKDSSICHGRSSFQQSRFSNLLALIWWNSSSMMHVEGGSNKNEPNWWRIQWEMMKKVGKSLEKNERIWRESLLDLGEWNVIINSVTINILYHMLNPFLNHN